MPTVKIEKRAKKKKRKINFFKYILSLTIFRRWKTVHKAEETPSPTVGFAMGLRNASAAVATSDTGGSGSSAMDYNRNQIVAKRDPARQGASAAPNGAAAAAVASRRHDINSNNNNDGPSQLSSPSSGSEMMVRVVFSFVQICLCGGCCSFGTGLSLL